MLLDSTFLIDLENEVRTGRDGRAVQFLARHGSARMSVSPVCAGEFYAGCNDFPDAKRFLARFGSVAFNDAVAVTAGLMEREQRLIGKPLGENDNWIAATARMLKREIVSRDKGFDGVRGVKRISY